MRSYSVCLVFVATTAVFAQSTPLTIYVGPQMRDGFVDVDQGVLDSIKDTHKELRKDKRLRIVATAADASLYLFIVRRAVADGPAAVVSIPMYGGGSMAMPIHGHYIESILKFGDYERQILSSDQEHGTWSRCAVLLAKDVGAWITANRAKLP